MNRPVYRWTYESIVDAIPGVTFPDWLALTIQFVLFEGVMLLLAWRYDLWHAVPAGTAAIVVATAGSALMLLIGRRVRDLSMPTAYRKLLFGSSIEVVLGVIAYVALITYLLVYTPRTGAPLLESLLGTAPPIPAVFLTLLVLWDVCYRIGTAWWASVIGFWVAFRHPTEGATRRYLRRVDAFVICFALLQLVLVPFVRGYDLLVFALVGHVVAVLCVSGSAIFIRTRGSTI
ncbi:hypothetical protein BG842_00200 [Haladaptatus sp. W1]|uniref:DUF7530 family protein n=1 Tax=Haladaptatus sp. W1 TaxID=1897478 RepID=UPI000849CA48|nr:hypothetical protein [Haladaptatus sp. W1]ODR81196.1 hypothetical protein BG842_00200 [Haladaptatus sp. W1]